MLETKRDVRDEGDVAQIGPKLDDVVFQGLSPIVMKIKRDATKIS